MQIDVAYVVVGLIANNTGQLIALQNSTLQHITSNQLLCRRTMVGEVVGLRKSKHRKEYYMTEQHSAIQNIVEKYLNSSHHLCLSGRKNNNEHNSSTKLSKTKVKTTKDRLTAL